MAITSARQIRVLDVGIGLAAALIAKHFSDIGAAVTRIAPIGGDPFRKRYPAYDVLRRDASTAEADAIFMLAAQADVMIVGGESHPGLEWSVDWAACRRENPRLVVINLTGGIDAGGSEQVAVDLLAQARSGLCWEQFTDRPIAWALPGPTFGQVSQALIGAWAALLEREESGLGQTVCVSLQEGAHARSHFVRTPRRYF